MQAVVLDGTGGIEVQERPVPEPGPGEVVIAPGATGICGTDLHLRDGHYAAGRYPLVPGHEFAGIARGDLDHEHFVGIHLVIALQRGCRRGGGQSSLPGIEVVRGSVVQRITLE